MSLKKYKYDIIRYYVFVFDDWVIYPISANVFGKQCKIRVKHWQIWSYVFGDYQISTF